MARAPRSRSRFVLAEQRIRAAQGSIERGESQSAALRRYRRYGGRISGERWRALWRSLEPREGTARAPRGGRPVEIRRGVRKPGGYLYNVQLVLGDMDAGRTETMWFAVKSKRRRPSSWAVGQAMQMFQQMRDHRGYGYVVLGGYVSSIEELVAAPAAG